MAFCMVLDRLDKGGLCGTSWREPPCTSQPGKGGYVSWPVGGAIPVTRVSDVLKGGRLYLIL